jgi:poly-beta-1,6 N-acetyl-D-glucosamine export porin PgaA
MSHLRRLRVCILCAVLAALTDAHAESVFFPVPGGTATESSASTESSTRTESTAPAETSSEHAAAVQLARSGELDQALVELNRLYSNAPENSAEAVALRHDLGIVHAWNGNHGEAVRLLGATPIDDQPDHVLSIYAESLHLTSQLEDAATAYRLLAQRQPDNPQPALGVFYVLMDDNRFDEAALELERISERFDDPSVSFATAYLANTQEGQLTALREYNKVLRADPGNRQALRGKALSALALGAPWQALAISRQHPGVLTDVEHQRLVLDTAAMQLRWGAVTARDQAEALATTRSAIGAQNTVLGARMLDELDVSHPVERALLFDRIVALQQNFEMEQAIELFESTKARLDDPALLPVYVLKSAGDAHLYQQEPAAARALYLQALERDPDHFPAQIGLFFAYSDYGEHEKAQAVLEEALAAQPAWIRPTERIWLENPAYASATELHAISPAYTGNYDQSLARLDELLAIAPASQSARVSRAQVMRWRGWPRAALLEAGRTLGEAPDNVYAGTTHAHTLMDVYRFEEAGDAVSSLDQSASHDPGVRTVMRRWHLHKRPELLTEAYFRNSDGDAEGTDEWHLDTRVYSAPIAGDFRIYAHDLFRTAEFAEGTGRDHRLGVGVEWRQSGIRLATELSTGFEDNDKAGLAIDGSWQIDDFWFVDGQLAANSVQVPLRATRIGVRGDEITLGGGYRWHEARQLSGRVMLLDMDDGNLRQSLGLDYRQRLRNGNRHRFNGLLEAYTSSNSEEDRIYFNPESDWSLAAGLEHEWVIHQRYDRSLVQKLGVDLGTYWQSGYGSGSTWTLRFQHDWMISDALSLGYGASTGSRIYDGNREHTNVLFFSLVARL